MKIKKHSSGFEQEWFEKYVTERLDEGPLIDRKQQLYFVGQRETDLSPEFAADRAEFIRDVIAFANAARRRGKPARIVFGLDDEEGRIIGIDRQTTHPDKRIGEEEWSRIREKAVKLSKCQEQIGKIYRDIAKRYIEPPPELEYQWAEVSSWREEGSVDLIVAYLKILPLGTDEPC